MDFTLGIGVLFCFLPLLFMDLRNKFPLIQLVSLFNFFAYFSPMIFHLEYYRYTVDVLFLREYLPLCQIVMIIGYYIIIANKKNFLKFSNIQFVNSQKLDSVNFNKFLNLVLFINIFDLFKINATLSQIAIPFSFILPVLLIYLSFSRNFKDISLFPRIILFAFVIIKFFSLALGGLLVPFLIYSFSFLLILFQYKKNIILWFCLGSVFFLSFSISKVKNEFRILTWNTNQEVSLYEKIIILNELINNNNNSSNVVIKNKINEDSQLIRIAHSYFYLCTVINQVDVTNDFYDGSTYIALIYKFIPRVIWKDKPIENLGQSVARKFNLLDDGDTSTSVNLPVWVEFYLNFGKFGTILMCFILGILFAYIDLKLNYNLNSNILDIAIKISLLINLFYLESNFTLKFGLLIAYVLIYKFIVKKLKLNN